MVVRPCRAVLWSGLVHCSPAGILPSAAAAQSPCLRGNSAATSVLCASVPYQIDHVFPRVVLLGMCSIGSSCLQAAIREAELLLEEVQSLRL